MKDSVAKSTARLILETLSIMKSDKLNPKIHAADNLHE
jgi:hypothetical protein